MLSNCFLTAIRNLEFFSFQIGYMNNFLNCCVSRDVPSIVFILNIYVLKYTYFSVRNLDFESRLPPLGNIPICHETKSSLNLPLLGAFLWFPKTTISFVLSVCLSVHPFAWNNWSPHRRILVRFDIGVVCENLQSKLYFHRYLTRITWNWLQDKYTI
jgi:hypothetical protein